MEIPIDKNLIDALGGPEKAQKVAERLIKKELEREKKPQRKQRYA
jgi:hypothetical protein